MRKRYGKGVLSYFGPDLRLADQPNLLGCHRAGLRAVREGRGTQGRP